MSGGFPEPARTWEELQLADVWGNFKVNNAPPPPFKQSPQYYHLYIYFSNHIGLYAIVPTYFLFVVKFLRTLLALGCHVGMGDEKAEENLKKIKLPKTYVAEKKVATFLDTQQGIKHNTALNAFDVGRLG